MVKRLLQIALLTGAAHLFTILTLKFLYQHISSKEIGSIGEIDSLFQFTINSIGFGLQLAVVRDISANENWKSIYKEAQSARFTLSLLLLPFALLYLFDVKYQYLLFAPVFALSGDYALYGKGRPVSAAFMAFLRVFIPSFVLILSSIWLKSYIIPLYIISTLFIYWITSVIITKWLDCPYWYKPSFRNLILYVESLSLGIVALSYYFVGLGLILLASSFYNDSVLANAYLGLKFYIVFKGVIRIINQAFIKEMVNDKVCLYVDQIAGLAGVAFCIGILIFPKSICSLLFTEQYYENRIFLGMIGVAGLLSSIYTSLTTRSMLKHKDSSYSYISAFAAFFSAALIIILSFVNQDTTSIGVALLSGEITLLGGLLWINLDTNLKERLYFLFQICLLVVLPLILRMMLGDSIFSLIGGMLLFSLLGAIILYKKVPLAQPLT